MKLQMNIFIFKELILPTYHGPDVLLYNKWMQVLSGGESVSIYNKVEVSQTDNSSVKKGLL